MVKPAMTSIERAVLELVAQLTRHPITDLRPEHHLRTDLGLDSLRAMELLALLDDRLGLNLTIEEGVALETVDALLAVARTRGIHAT
jgi:acyl carrier protein